MRLPYTLGLALILTTVLQSHRFVHAEILSGAGDGARELEIRGNWHGPPHPPHHHQPPPPHKTYMPNPPRPTGHKPNHSHCSESKQCKSGNCQNSRCQDPMDVGGSCYKDVSCKGDLVCTSHNKKYPGKCVCQTGQCGKGSYCTSGTQCSGGLFCPGAVRGTGNCQPRLSNGSACKTNNYCTSQNCVSKKCVGDRSIQPGGTCNKDTQCAGKNFCSYLKDYKCSPQYESGHSCSRAAACRSGNCSGGRNKRCT